MTRVRTLAAARGVAAACADARLFATAAAKHLYDHHQRGFEHVFGHGARAAAFPRRSARLRSRARFGTSPAGFTTKLSSAGLVYKHFGREVVAAELGFGLDDPRLETVYLKARTCACGGHVFSRSS